MRRTGLVLTGILALALGLRMWSIGWGMPYSFHPDEDNYLVGAVRMLLEGDLNPHYFRNPPLLTYTVLVELLTYLGAGRVLGFLNSAADVGHQMLVSPTFLFVLARTNGAVLGTATVLLTYLCARRLFDTRTGLLGALLLAVTFLHVRDSHYAVNDVPATFVLMASFYFATRVYSPAAGRLALASQHSARTDYLLAGGFLGLAIATKYNVGLGAAAILAAHLLRPRRPGEIATLSTHLPLLGAGLASLVAFLLANPYALLDPRAFLQGFADQSGWALDPYHTTDLDVGLVILRALSNGTSPLLVGASVLGLALVALRQPRAALLLAAFPATYLTFFLLRTDLFYARFAIPLLPFVAIAAACVGERLISRVPSGTRRAIAGTLLAALLVLPPLALDVQHNLLLRAEDTRLLLGRWIEANVPPGSKLAVEGYSFLDMRGHPTGPKKIEYSLSIVPSLRVNPLEFYVQEGFDYVVASSYVYGRYPLDPAAHADAVASYRRLELESSLVATISPTADDRELPFLMDEETTPFYWVFERNRPGPTLKVYRVGPPPRYGVAWLETSVPSPISPAQRLSLRVAVRNSGNLAWPSEGFTPARVGYRWLDAAGREVEQADLHSPLPHQVEPGEEVEVPVELVAPSTPGSYTLRLDLVQENFAWFSAKGSDVRDVRVDVAAR